MDDQLEAIRARKEKRNLEIEKMCESKENATNAMEKEIDEPNPMNKVSVLIHKFNAAATAEAALCGRQQSPSNFLRTTPSKFTSKIPLKLPPIKLPSTMQSNMSSSTKSPFITPVKSPSATIPTKSPITTPTKSPSTTFPSKSPMTTPSKSSTSTTFPPSKSSPPITSSRSPSTTLSKTPPSVTPTKSAAPVPIKIADDHFRPITPTDQIIGTLWDDINSELQKYKEAKKNQSDPNLSPRSRYGISESSHSIFSYRSQGSSTKRSSGVMDTNAMTSKEVTINSSYESTLPEKRHRSESESETGTTENGMDTDKKDQTDSNTIRAAITADQEAYMKRLHEMIIVQQDQICQASRALAFCRQNEHFRGGREEIDAQRALLISTERRRALLVERDRLINSPSPPSPNEPKGTLTFSSISIRLNREYISSYVQQNASTNRYYFIVLIKCGEQVFHTSLESSDKGIKSGFVEFQHYIPVTGLSPEFVCQLEVYSLKSSRSVTDEMDRSGRSKKGTWRRMVISTPLNAYTNTLSAYSTGNAHRPIGVMDPGFQRVGHVTITRQLIGRQKFLLNDVVYPLDGSCLLNTDCHSDQNAAQQCMHRSFLSLYQIVSGLGSWSRYWCVLGNGQINFWRYPEDETTKVPTAHLELSWCVSHVTPVQASMASFPNSMQLDVVTQPKVEGGKKECIRMMFAADSPTEKDFWIQAINQAIKNANVWRLAKRKITATEEGAQKK